MAQYNYFIIVINVKNKGALRITGGICCGHPQTAIGPRGWNAGTNGEVSEYNGRTHLISKELVVDTHKPIDIGLSNL